MRGKIVAATIVIATVFSVAFHLNYVINVEYQYNRKIGSYLENAFDASTFEIMKENYISAKRGMLGEGLRPEDYGRWFYWEQTPDWQMNYTYSYIDGLVVRCDYYINVTKISNISPYTDIYNQMISNMRTESQRNGPVDWTAKPAWLIKNAPIYYWSNVIWLTAMLIVLAVIIAASTIGENAWFKQASKYRSFG